MRDCEVINENLRCALAAFSWVDPAGETQHSPGLSLAYSGSPFGLFNTALLTDPLLASGFADQLDIAASYFGRRRAPWSIWFCEDFFGYPARRQNGYRLSAMGLKSVMEAPGMISRGIAPPRARLPEVECRRVADRRTAADFSRIMASAFAVPVEMADRVYAGARLWTGPVRGYVAYSNGEAVSTTAAVFGGGAVGLYAVGTDPSFQRCGYGESLMRIVLDEARRETGIETVVLQSSPAGYPLYLRMGFRHVTRFSVFLAEGAVHRA